jgi:hypothetical protein
MGKIVIPQIDRRKVTAGAIVVGGAASTSMGQDAIATAEIAVDIAKEIALEIGVGIGEGAAAIQQNPILAGQCAVIGAATAVNNPIKFYAGVSETPQETMNGFATQHMVKGMGLTLSDIESDACQAGMTIGSALPTLAGGAITTRVTRSVARELGLKSLADHIPEATSRLGKAFQSGTGTVAGIGADYVAAKALLKASETRRTYDQGMLDGMALAP